MGNKVKVMRDRTICPFTKHQLWTEPTSRKQSKRLPASLPINQQSHSFTKRLWQKLWPITTKTAQTTKRRKAAEDALATYYKLYNKELLRCYCFLVFIFSFYSLSFFL